MNNDQKHSVFTLIYAVVLIDNRVMKVEVDQFFMVLEDFLTSVSFINTLGAKTYISTWFVQNYKNILKEMKSPNRETYLLEHVENLKFNKNKQAIFDMMQKVATADNEYHDLEQNFLKRVSEVWKLADVD